MHAIVRLGPYVCGEWEFGGFPARLLSYDDMVLRTNQTDYMNEVSNWYTNHLLPQVKPKLYQNGGPIVMVQVENEYGSYGNVDTNPGDEAYLRHLMGLAKEGLGDDTFLITTDGGNTGMMGKGSLKGGELITFGDFGPGADVNASIAAQKSFNPPMKSPPFCAEYYPGWLTHWGEAMALTDSATIVHTMEQMLNVSMGFNLYMAHGGTSREFWSGVNGGGPGDFEVDITSYDYNSPISEGAIHNHDGNGRDKYTDIKNTLNKYFGEFDEEPAFNKFGAYGSVFMTKKSKSSLYGVMSGMTSIQDSVSALTQEKIKQVSREERANDGNEEPSNEAATTRGANDGNEERTTETRSERRKRGAKR